MKWAENKKHFGNHGNEAMRDQRTPEKDDDDNEGDAAAGDDLESCLLRRTKFCERRNACTTAPTKDTHIHFAIKKI